MFGFVTANIQELSPEEKHRYQAVYCGVCRQIRERSSNLSRLGLRYDLAFLALLLMSLYEPEEQSGSRACRLHPLHPRPWLNNEYVGYAADMNVALGYYNALDDWEDSHSQTARVASRIFGKHCPEIAGRFPRQCEAIAGGIRRLRELELSGCDNPDLPAGVFGELMGELLVYREDLWADTLRAMGFFLGRFIYLADAAIDYRRDVRKKEYNPFAAMGTGYAPGQWEQYLVLAMAQCTANYEKLPLVQDKALLDNILYSGIWLELRRKQKEQGEVSHDG